MGVSVVVVVVVVGGGRGFRAVVSEADLTAYSEGKGRERNESGEGGGRKENRTGAFRNDRKWCTFRLTAVDQEKEKKDLSLSPPPPLPLYSYILERPTYNYNIPGKQPRILPNAMGPFLEVLWQRRRRSRRLIN